MRFFFENLLQNFEEEQTRHILWLPVLFGLGIGLYFWLQTEPSLWVTLIGLEILIFGVWLKRNQPRALYFLSAVLVVALGFTNACLRAVYQFKQIDPPSGEEITYLSGRIKQLDRNAKGKVRLLLSNVSDFDNARKGLYRITLHTDKNLFKTGQCVEMVATIMRPPLTVLPHGYQFDRKAFFEGISAMGFSNSMVYVIPCASKTFHFSDFLARLRAQLVQQIYSTLPSDEAGIAAALVAGDRNGIRKKLYDQYRDAGLAHFLSISGLHIGLIAAMAFFIFRLLIALIPRLALKHDSRKSAAVFAILVSFLYLLISGMGIPAQRAFLMALVVFMGILFSREAVSMRTAALTALVLLVISPQILISAGFQMSFAAVVVLIAFYERYATALHRFFAGGGLLWTMFAYFAGLMATDLVASLATMPFTIYHFNQIAIYSLLGNLLAGPIIGFVVMPFVLISLMSLLLGVAYYPLQVVGWGIGLINDITAWVSALPYAGFRVMSFPLWGFLLIVLGGLWLCLWERSWRCFGFLPIILGILSVFCVQKPDVLYDASGKNLAVLDRRGNLVVMPTRGQDFVKSVWLEKTVSLPMEEADKKNLKEIYEGQRTDFDWLLLQCDEKSCVYRDVVRWMKNGGMEIEGQEHNSAKDGGGAVYLYKNGTRVQTVRQSVGHRLWN